MSEAGFWSNTSPCRVDSGQDGAKSFAIQHRGKLLFTGGIDIRWVHQLPRAN